MIKRISLLVLASAFMLNAYGCALLLGGAAGGAGTAVWLSEKLTQEVNASFERSVKAVESALHDLRLEVTKKTAEKEVAQIMSKYSDGKTIWIDVRKISDTASRIEVRVGAVHGDKQAAQKILKRIDFYL